MFAEINTPTIFSDISSAAYMGCYSDVGAYATFIKHLKNMTNVTPAACRKGCSNESLSFIGLWVGLTL